MKFFLLFVAMLVMIGLGILYLRKPAAPAPAPSTELMGTDQTGSIQTQSTEPAQPSQTVSPQAEKEVVGAFKSQVTGSVTSKETVVAETYALQVWTDTFGGGEALLSRTGSSGWKLLSMGGGAWSVEGLIAAGVPEKEAIRLIQNRKWSN